MKSNTRKFLTSTLLAAGLAASPLLSGDAMAKTLRIGAQADAGTMDPQAQNIMTTITLLSMIYDSLVSRDGEMQPQPRLATSWEQVEPTRWRFVLREGVTFHDGADFTAEDVAFTIERAQQPTSQFLSMAAGLKTEIVDDYTIDIITPERDIFLPSRMISLAIMDKDWAEANGSLAPQNLGEGEESFSALNANGTGPYKLISRVPDSKTVLEATGEYWGEMAGDIDTVEFYPLSNDPTRVAALLSNEVDLLIDVPAQDVARLEAAPGIKTEMVDEYRTLFIGFDHASDTLKYGDAGGKNPFKDPKVRQAISHAIDRQAIKRTVMRGLANPTTQMLAPKNVGYVEELDTLIPYDREKAKELLAEAGYPDGFSVTFDCPNNRYINDEQVCRTLVTMLAQIGIEADLNAMPRAQYFPKLWERDTSMFLMGINSPFADGIYNLEKYTMTRNDETGDGIYNYTQSDYPELNARVEDARRTEDEAERVKKIEDLYRYLTEEQFYVGLYNQVLVYAMQENVSAPVRPDNWLEIRWVTMDE
ncbi:MAG: ABC transporter substrate-binding protein [Rhodobacteraceae bacterium]|nr:ABC transporter substrate-binding protein [Paracoccaceae bacterium]